MTAHVNYTINDRGLNEIAGFLGARHKLGRDHFDRSMLLAWASDAESQLSDGNSPTIEIRSWDTHSGHTETHTISDDGFDVEIINEV